MLFEWLLPKPLPLFLPPAEEHFRDRDQRRKGGGQPGWNQLQHQSLLTLLTEIKRRTEGWIFEGSTSYGDTAVVVLSGRCDIVVLNIYCYNESLENSFRSFTLGD